MTLYFSMSRTIALRLSYRVLRVSNMKHKTVTTTAPTNQTTTDTTDGTQGKTHTTHDSHTRTNDGTRTYRNRTTNHLANNRGSMD